MCHWRVPFDSPSWRCETQTVLPVWAVWPIGRAQVVVLIIAAAASRQYLVGGLGLPEMITK